MFRLALRQTEGLIGSILQLLGLDLPVLNFSTLSRRAQNLELPAQPRATGGAIHLLVDSSGLKLSGPGEWLDQQRGEPVGTEFNQGGVGELDSLTGRGGDNYIADEFSRSYDSCYIFVEPAIPLDLLFAPHPNQNSFLASRPPVGTTMARLTPTLRSCDNAAGAAGPYHPF